MIGQHPDDKETGIGHRAGQGYQHQQSNGDRKLRRTYRRSD
jgi:hypothetical protein